MDFRHICFFQFSSIKFDEVEQEKKTQNKHCKMNVQINSSMQPKLMYIYLNGWWLEFVANASRMKYCSICAVVSHTVPRIYPQMHGCTWPAAGWEWRKKSHLMRRYLCGHFSCYYWRKICALAAGRQFTMRIFFFHSFIYLSSFVDGT